MSENRSAVFSNGEMRCADLYSHLYTLGCGWKPKAEFGLQHPSQFCMSAMLVFYAADSNPCPVLLALSKSCSCFGSQAEFDLSLQQRFLTRSSVAALIMFENRDMFHLIILLTVICNC